MKVIYTAKAGKRPGYEAKSFRPISLSSFCLKSMERVVDRHITDNVLKYNPLHYNQFAYRESKSTEAALKKLVNTIKKNHRHYVLGAFIDIAGAFDNTSHESIKRALGRKGVDSKTCGWISAMLRERQAVLTVGSSTKKFDVTTGCPQGGVLSPLLWSLVIDELIVKLSSTGFYIQVYADDVAILVNALCLTILRELLERALRMVTYWCKKNKLSISQLKLGHASETETRVSRK